MDWKAFIADVLYAVSYTYKLEIVMGRLAHTAYPYMPIISELSALLQVSWRS